MYVYGYHSAWLTAAAPAEGSHPDLSHTFFSGCKDALGAYK